MKWTTYDGTEATLPPEDIAVLIESPDGQVFVGVFGIGTNRRVYIHTARHTATGLIKPGDRWLPLSAITPERVEAVEKVLSRLRAAHEEFNYWGGMLIEDVIYTFGALRELDALEAK